MHASASVVLLTPAGRAAVATLLVEGPDATQLVSRQFEPAGRPLAEQPIGRIAYGRWRTSGEEVVVCRRDSGCVEIHCHGGAAAARAIVASLVDSGLNEIAWRDWIGQHAGDRLQAEARIALADATTQRAALVLWDQHEGALGRAIDAIAERIALGEQEEACEMATELLSWSTLGLHLTRPWKVVLAGRPNVGKSSLVNALVGYTRAIVHETPGTTRDVLTAPTAVDGWPVELVDTAGLRSGGEPLEAAGIELARGEAQSADLVLLVLDRSQPLSSEDVDLLDQWPAALVVLNKCDLPAAAGPLAREAVEASATTGAGLDEVIAAIARRLVPQAPPAGQGLPFLPRHQVLLAELRRDLVEGNLHLAGELIDRLRRR